MEKNEEKDVNKGCTIITAIFFTAAVVEFICYLYE